MIEGGVPSLGWRRERRADAEPDLPREMERMVVTALRDAEADELCGAGYGGRSPERVDRHRGLQSPAPGSFQIGRPLPGSP